jgi:hypothetical protein
MWRIRKNNLIINDKDKLFVHRVHLERLLHAKTHIKNKGPEIPYFMKNNLSKKELMRVNERKRCYENALIFSRLLEINNSISPYSKTIRPIYCPCFDKKKYDFNKTEKRKNLYKQNSFIFTRLIHEKSYYPTNRFLNTNNFEIYLKDIIKRQRSDNPNINFATFKQFKKNIKKSYKLKKSYSAEMLEPACLNSKRGMNETDIFSRNINLNYGQTSNLEDKPCKCINEYKSKRNNIGESSTLVTTRRRKNSFNRCQSAFIRSQNNFYN